MPRPNQAPTRTPTRTKPETSPNPQRERRIDPARICPDQKDKIVRRVAPHLP